MTKIIDIIKRAKKKLETMEDERLDRLEKSNIRLKRREKLESENTRIKKKKEKRQKKQFHFQTALT